jgi:3',5'-cyclic AMP phosphodiesterase CpdA
LATSETSGVEDPPPRQPWEEPPPAGWSSQLFGVGLETLWLVASIVLTGCVFRVATFARHYGEAKAASAWHQAAVVGLWLLSCLLAAGVIAYVWKRLGGFALVGAMLTDYGRVARLGGRPPVWLDAPPDDALRVAQLSDLHVTEGERVRMVEKPAPGGNPIIGRLLDEGEIANSQVLLFTGDVTDRGTAVAWRHFLDALDERDLADRAILVPGNHDLGMVDPLDGRRERKHVLRSDRFGIINLANLLKFSEAFAETGGGRHGFVLGDDGPVPYQEAWEAAERAVRPLVAALPTLPVPSLRWGTLAQDRAALVDYQDRIEVARQRLLALFPVAIPLDAFAPGQDAVVFVLNSCASLSRHPTTNALGHVGRAQYRRLNRLAGFFHRKLKLLALHHHVVRRSEERGRSFWSRVMAKFTVLGDSRPLVRFCRKAGVRAVLNGHRHLSYQLRLPNGTVLLAAPSSTLGDELAEDPRPRFERYDLAPDPTPPSVGIFRRVVLTSPAPAPASSPAGEPPRNP